MDRPLSDRTSRPHRGGRGGRGGGGGGGRFRGGKRPREEVHSDPDGSKALLHRVFHLGDPNNDVSIDKALEDLAYLLSRDQGPFDRVAEAVVECAIQLTDKTPCYAVLSGLLNSEDPSFGEQIVARAHSEFLAAMEEGKTHQSRMLLRFFSSLVISNVVLPSSLVALLSEVVAAANSAAASNEGTDGRLWQPWADFLVYSVLICLPWAGAELAEGADQALDELLSAVESYMSQRPRQHSAALMPFRGGAANHEDPALRSDSGAASFLGRVWDAVQELKASGWATEAIPSLHRAHESKLAQGCPHGLPEAPARPLPSSPPCITPGMTDIAAAAALAATYPPRGAISLLPAGTESSGEGRLAAERIVVEEYILDTLHWFEGDRRETVMRLSHLPVPFPHQAIIVEVLFGQLLCLPMPPRKPVGYLTVMVDCMKTIERFSKPLSGCVRELFARMELLDPELQGRLAEWLAYHLSCFEFMWPWEKWAHVLEKPPSDAQQRFCAAVLSRMLRLSYHSKVVESVPPSFAPILPPNPQPQPLDRPMKDVLQHGAGEPHLVTAGSEERRCTELLAEFVKKKASSEQVLQWTVEQGLEEELGGGCGVLAMVLRTLLVAGAKSFTHTLIALERYTDALTALLEKAGEDGEDTMVEVASKVWLSSPQQAAIAVDRLMGMRLVQCNTIVRWVFNSGMLRSDQELTRGLAWEAIVNCTNKIIARASDEHEILGDIRAAVAQATGDEAQLEMLQGELDKQLTAVREAETNRDTHLLDVCGAYVELLNSQLRTSDDAEMEGGEQEPQQEPWVGAVLGSFRAFIRTYHSSLAPISSTVLNDILAESSAHPTLRSAASEMLLM